MAFRIDGGDVAGGEPAILAAPPSLPRTGIPGRPRGRGSQVAERHAVMRQFVAIGIDDLDVGTIDRAALFQSQPCCGFLVQTRGGGHGAWWVTIGLVSVMPQA